MLATELQERFWSAPPPLPKGVTLLRQDALVVPQRGPGGLAMYDLGRFQMPSGQAPVLMAFRPILSPADVPRLKAMLMALAHELQLRGSTGRDLPTGRTPMLVTEVASKGVVDRCEREGVALADLSGTLLLNTPAAFIRVEKTGLHRRTPRTPTFHGKGARLVRLILAGAPEERWSVRRLAQLADISYAYAHGVVQLLVEHGFVEHVSAPRGLRVQDPVGLLRAWLDSGRRTAASVQGFYAPATTPESLMRGERALRELGVRTLFSLASALLPDERIATGLPHGVYVSGSLGPVIEAFGLRSAQPHNFLVMRAEPAAETDAGGIYMAARHLEHGRGVALPQLAVDFWHSGGRGREQAEELVTRFARRLPLVIGA